MASKEGYQWLSVYEDVRVGDVPKGGFAIKDNVLFLNGNMLGPIARIHHTGSIGVAVYYTPISTTITTQETQDGNDTADG